MSDLPPWIEMIAPITSKCEVAVHFGSELTFNRDGAAALGQLLKNMATLLDMENAERRALSVQPKGEGGGDG